MAHLPAMYRFSSLGYVPATLQTLLTDPFKKQKVQRQTEMSKSIAVWTGADVYFLTKNHSKMTDAELSEALGRSIRSVSHKRQRLGLGSAKRAVPSNAWPGKDDRFILQNPHMRLKDVAKVVGRTKAAVAHRRKTLGISVPKSETAWKDHEIRFLKENPKMPTAEMSERLGRTHVGVGHMRRKCGLLREKHYPWSLEEETKLGKNISLPLGDLYKLFPNRTYASVHAKARKMNRKRHRRTGHSITPKGYIEITINGRRVFEHVWVMERANGRKLKKGEVVHHIDCDKANNNLGNLDLMQSDQHQVAHNSFRKLIRPLLDSGYIVYDFEKHRYEVGKL